MSAVVVAFSQRARAVSKDALDRAVGAFIDAWPIDSYLLPPWPLDWQDNELRAFVRYVLSAGLPALGDK